MSPLTVLAQVTDAAPGSPNRPASSDDKGSRHDALLQPRRFAPRHGGDPLLERDAELDHLLRAFKRAQAGRGSVVTVDGSVGVGKSQLLLAAGQMGREHGLEVLTATGREIERQFAFGVALQLFEARVMDGSDKERRRMLAGPAELAAPLLAPVLGEEVPAEVDAFSLVHGLYWLCAHLALERPLVLMIDEAQHADRPSLQFALYLAQRVAEVPICLVLAGVLRPPRPSAEDLAELVVHPVASAVTLKPLSPDAVAIQLRSVLFPHARDEFCRACFESTRGNPFLLRELALELASEGEQGDDDPAHVLEVAPESVTRSVLLRLHGMGPGALELAQAVAVLGGGAELRHAARIAELKPAHAPRVADELMVAGVLERAELLSFVQPIVSRALEAAMPPGERAAAHLCAARLLDAEGASLQAVAAHLVQSTRTGSEWAVDVLADAAAASTAIGAPESAIRYLRRALEEPPSPSRRSELVLDLGRAEAVLAAPEAVPRLREALELIHEPVGRGVAALDLGRTLCAQGRHQEGAEELRRGLLELEGAQPQLRAQLQASYALAARAGPPAEPLHRDATPEVGRSAGGPASHLALADRALRGALEGEPVDHVRELARAALGRGALLRVETADGLGYYLATTALTLCEDYETAEVALTAAIEDARARGSALGLATACGFRAFTNFGRGRLGDAEMDAESALAAVPHAHGFVVPAAHAVLAEVEMEQGQVNNARRRLESSTAPEGSGLVELMAIAAEAHLRLQCGDAAGALARFEACGARLARANVRNPAALRWRSGAALALAELGRWEGAERLLDEQLELARRFGAPGAIGSTLSAAALLATGDRRIRLLLAALEALEQSEKALSRARVLVELGSTLRRTGKRREARDPLRRGLDLAHRCGATVLAQRALDELTAAGARPRRTALKGLESLTARERQVAEMAADGTSNRGIAEAHFVTVKTVEWHLRNVYVKLGVRSRRELGAAMARRKGPPAPGRADT